MNNNGGTAADGTAKRLAAEIRRLRSAAGLSHAELAGAIGYSRQYVAVAERPGKGLASADLVVAIDNHVGANGSLVKLRAEAAAERTSRRRHHTELAIDSDHRGQTENDATSHEGMLAFWRLAPGARIDIVCSEIPEEERPEFASPRDRNYLRYAKFADLDSLIYLRTRLAQLSPIATLRDFSPSEYYDTQTDVLTVVGGPSWNAKYREFLPQLPFYFEPHPLGEDDPLVVPNLDVPKIGPHWTQDGTLLEDIAVFTRLTLAAGTTVFLLGGCLTLGVLGATQLFLQRDRGVRSTRYISDHVGDRDFVVVTETRRVGGIADITDLETVNPLLLLARKDFQPFEVVFDNTARYVGDPTPVASYHS